MDDADLSREAFASGALIADLQEMVDGLADRLGRSVAIDDRGIRLIVSSRHFGDEDVLRVHSVMGRSVSTDLIEQLRELELEQLTEPTRIAPIDGLLPKPRWCFPMRWNSVLLGYLWLIEDETLGSADIRAAAELADRAALVLYRRDVLFERRQAAMDAVLRDLLSGEPSLRSVAAREITHERLIRDPSRLQVVMVDLGDPVVEASEGQSIGAALLRESRDLLSRVFPGTVLTRVRSRGMTLLISGDAVQDDEGAVVSDLVARLRATVRSRVVAGLGSEVGGLTAARQSYEQARVAARVALILPELGSILRWQDTGVYALLSRLSPNDLEMGAFPPQVLRLAAARHADMLMTTAEHYLDLAGDAQAASAALHIHRATLYQRLERIEDISGLNLKRGSDRLTLHLAIKLARLTEQWETLLGTT